MGDRRTYDDDVRVRITSHQRRRLEEIAHARSEPGDTVTPSHVVRDAIDDYLDREETDDSVDEAQATN